MFVEKDTLQYQQKHRPGALHLDHSNVPLSNVIVGLKKHYDDHSSKVPESDAIDFYMCNHASAIIAQRVHPLEPLGDYIPVMNMYHSRLQKITRRMFHYLLLIVTRESRHVYDSDPMWFSLLDTCEPELIAFTKHIRSGGSSAAMHSLMNKTPITSLGNYTAYLEKLFFEGQFSGGYGGPAWGEIAKVLNAYVQGKYSAEIMVDTSFTLCHNNGPIFNKGVIYSGHSTMDLMKILDVQRAGQIPQLVANNESSKLSTNHRNRHQAIATVLGDEFKGYVDWFAVEKLGAINTYANEKSKQEQEHGKYDETKQLASKAKFPLADLADKKILDKQEKLKLPMFAITSDMLVPIVTMDRDNGGINAYTEE